MYASVAASVKNEPIFKEFEVLQIRKNMRAGPNEKNFSDWLCNVGAGKNHIKGSNEIELPLENTVNSSDELIDFCFQDLFSAKDPLSKSEIIADAAILAPTNDNVTSINNKALGKLNGDLETFVSKDTPLIAGNDYTSTYNADNNIESIHNEMPSGFPPHILELKVKIFNCIFL